MQILNQEGHFKTKNGLRLFDQSWELNGERKAGVIIVHGYGEHSGRYHWLTKRLLSHGFSVYTYDHRGHGKSEGLRGYIPRHRYLLDDLGLFLDRVQGKEENLFLLGQGTGACALLYYALERQLKAKGLILCGAAIKLRHGVSWWKAALSRIMATVLPTLNMPGFLFKINPSHFTRNHAVGLDYRSDPFVYQGELRSRTGWELIRSMRHIHRKMDAVRLPLLILHGEADNISDPKGSRELYERARTERKTLKLYAQASHEVFQDLDRERIFQDTLDWLNAQLAPPKTVPKSKQKRA